MKKIFSIFSLILCVQLGFAQLHKGNLKKVSENGLHQIMLSPEVQSASKNNINSIRIFDAKNNEVPYLLFQGNTSTSEQTKLNIIAKKAVPNVSTSVIISNENEAKLDHLTLTIANTDVEKKYNISGSNDNKEWFGLINNQTISNLSESGKTFVQRDFSFPLNNYKYIKFNFIDKNSLPINVLEASINKNFTASKNQLELSGFEQKISSDKTNKTTQIIISFKNPQLIDGIKFDITAPNFYNRNAKILVEKTMMKKNREEKYLETVNTFSLASKNNNQFTINDLFTQKFIVEIENLDNPELDIKKIALFQNPVSILADLKANENYTIKIDPKYTVPSYDMLQSGINFNQNYPTTSVDQLENIQQKEASKSEQKFWQTPLFMWICIILAVLIIGYFSIVMIKDMNKEN